MMKRNSSHHRIFFDGGAVLQIVPRRGRPRAHGPMRRGRLRGAALVEPDADPFFLAPGDVARPFQLLRGHKKREAVGDGQRDHDFERGSGLREIPYRAVDCPAAELNGSGLQ